jgi:peroxiredoxin
MHDPEGEVLAVGARAPDFELDGTAGPVALSRLLKKGFFYPGNNTPG